MKSMTLKLICSAFICSIVLACGESHSSKEDANAVSAGDHHHVGHGDHHHEGHGDHQTEEGSKLGLFLAEIEWAAAPVAGQPVNEATLMIFNPEGEVIEAELKGFHPWMPAHGHGANQTILAWEPATGPAHSFAISGLFFNMPGEWQIRVVVEIDGQSDEIYVSIPGEVK